MEREPCVSKKDNLGFQSLIVMNTGRGKIVSRIWEFVCLYWCVCILRSWVLVCAVPQSWGSWRKCCTCSTHCSPKMHNSTISAARSAPENTSTSPLIPGWLGYRPWAIQKVPDLLCSAQQLLEYETISLRCNHAPRIVQLAMRHSGWCHQKQSTWPQHITKQAFYRLLTYNTYLS